MTHPTALIFAAVLLIVGLYIDHLGHALDDPGIKLIGVAFTATGAGFIVYAFN